MRYGRLIFGAGVILLALWVIIGEQLGGVSANAFVNARLSTLRAPVAGVLAMPEREIGTRVQRGEELASLEDRLVDGVRLDELLLEEALLEAELNRLEALRLSLEASVAALGERAARYGAERIAELEVQLEHARHRLALMAAGEPESGELPLSEALALDAARERVGVLEIALRGARAGTYLGDGYNDAPHAEQRRIELEAAMAEAGMARAAAQQRLAALRERLARERLRVNRFGQAPVIATVNGRIWEALAAGGETLARGQQVLRLVDCDSAIVTLSVTEAIYNRLRIGDSAVFRLMGDNRSLGGSVIRLAGSGAGRVYENLAVTPGERHLERYDVALLVPALREEPELACAIGRTGRVFFEPRPLDRLRRALGR